MKYGVHVNSTLRPIIPLQTPACSSRRPLRKPLLHYLTVRHINLSAFVFNNDALKFRVERLQDSKTQTAAALSRALARGPNPDPMKADIKFISTPTSDTAGTSLLLSTQDKNYLFGQIHEGFQRAALLQGLNLLKTRDCFLSGKTEWSNIGGLLGFILSSADRLSSSKQARADEAERRLARRQAWEKEEADRVKNGMKPRKGAKPGLKSEEEEGDPTLAFRSGPNLLHTLAAARSFIFRQGMPVKVEEFEERQRQSEQGKDALPDFADDNIRVWALPILPRCGVQPDHLPRPQSPRKRSHDDFIDGQKDGQDPAMAKPQLSPEQQTRAAVVKEMFHSDWSSQKLIEVPLHSVNTSATVFVQHPETGAIVPYEGPLPDGKTQVPNIPVFVREPWPGALINKLPLTGPSDVAMSYIVKSYEQRGKFLPKEAKRLGVRPGFDFGNLTKGISVQAKDGSTVTPDMVLEPSKEASGFAIFDVPSLEYLLALKEGPETNDTEKLRGIRHFIWLLGPGIADKPAFLELIEAIKGAKHTVSSPDLCKNDIAMTPAAIEHYRHREIDPDRFTTLVLDSEQVSAEGREGGAYTIAKSGLTLHVLPTTSIDDTSCVPAFQPTSMEGTLPPDIAELAQDVRRQVGPKEDDSIDIEQDLPSPNAEVICLGTGSMIPSPTRNVSGTLVRVPGCGTYLLDCGENTLGQMRRLFPREKLNGIFHDLKMIWISHLHADHHLGTISVVKAWYNAVYGTENNASERGLRPSNEEDFVAALTQSPKLLVASNSYMARWLDEYAMVEDFGYHQVLPLETTYRPPSNPLGFGHLTCFGLDLNSFTSVSQRVIQEATGIDHLRYCRVKHCRDAYAVSIANRHGFKFSYSGDCRPSEVFSKMGKGSNLLIHEATFDDEMKAEARKKNHSTISEAIEVGAAMDARQVLLTHFSQRYAKIPTFSNLDKRAIRFEDAEDGENEAIPIDATGNTALDDQGSGLPMSEISRPNGKESSGTEYAQDPDLTSQDHDIEATSTYTQASQDALSAAQRPEPDMKIGIAFDHMRVKVSDIMHLEKFYPIMQRLSDHLEESKAALKEVQTQSSPTASKPSKDRVHQKISPKPTVRSLSASSNPDSGKVMLEAVE